MDAKTRGQRRRHPPRRRGTPAAGKRTAAPNSAAVRFHNSTPPADLNLTQMEPLFRSTLQRCVNTDQAPERVDAARSLWRIFRECLRRLESARTGVREATGAFTKLNRFLEEDRRRLAHELHDESSQLLANIHIALSDLGPEVGARPRRRLKSIRSQLDRVQDQIRRISHELRPTVLDDFGLMPALRFLSQGISSRSGLEIALTGSTHGRLPGRVEMTLYRVVQEALNNAAKHAHASRVQIRLRRYPRSISCSIRDDGVGLEESLLRNHGGFNALGLLGIRVRVAALDGSLRIDSKHGTGTHLKISLPLEE